MTRKASDRKEATTVGEPTGPGAGGAGAGAGGAGGGTGSGAGAGGAAGSGAGAGGEHGADTAFGSGAGAGSGVPRRVLVVEDEQHQRAMLTRAVTEMGFEVTAASSAEEGLELIDASPPSVAVLDLNLPGMSGLELAAVLRERRPATRLIILTGYGDLPAARDAIRLDVVDFLLKPCPLDELERALDRAYGKAAGAAGAADAGGAASAPGTPGAASAPGTASAGGGASTAGESGRAADGAYASDASASASANASANARPDAFTDVTGSARSASDSAALPKGPVKIDDAERQLILQALDRHDGNRTKAAAELGISVRTLYYRLSRYEMENRRG